MSQKYILNKSKKLSFLVFFRPHLSVLASFLFGRSGYRRRAFRYIFARFCFLLAHSKYGLGTSTGSVTSSPFPFPNPVPLAKDAAPIPNALAAIKN